MLTTTFFCYLVVDMSTSRLLFVGTGVSTATPVLGHLSRGLDSPPCAVCEDALNPHSKNHRNNCSLLIEHNQKVVLIDTGKTFRDAFMKVMLAHRITTFHAVMLSHGHADALVGVDDLRDFQRFEKVEGSSGKLRCLNPIPVALTDATLQRLRRVAPYVTEPSLTGNIILERRVTLLSFQVLPAAVHTCEIVPGLSMSTFPVLHGPGEALGFAFGTATRVVYLPSVTAIPQASMEFLLSFPIAVLIVDLPHSVDGVWALVHKLTPREFYCTGVGCKDDHYTLCAQLGVLLVRDHSLLPNTTMATVAYDGMEVRLVL